MSIFGQPKRTAKSFSGVTPQQVVNSGSLGLRGAYAPARTLRGLAGGLGTATITSQVPWQCWQSSDFQTCHAQSYAQAASACATDAATMFDGNMDNCMITYGDQFDAQNCEPKYCASYMPLTQQPAAVAAIKTIQTQLNVTLQAQGFKPLVVDGLLGPATCGAAAYLNSTALYPYLQAGVCTTLTYPTKVGSTTPVSVATLPTIPITPGQTAPALITHQWLVADSQMAQVQNDCNVILSAHGYKAIAITGMLDAATCGAMQWIKANTGTDMLSVSGQNCQAYIAPTKIPTTITPGSTPLPPGISNPPTPGKISTASMAMGGIALLCAGGAYYYAKKKGMV